MTAQLVELKDFSEGRGEMAETWKREELYRDVWREPMLQLAKKYGVSDVMLAKVCRKLHIPVPGRGYWVRKASGQKLSVEPLPELKDVPVIQRFKLPEPESREPKIPEPEPADSEYLRIKEIETLKIAVDTNAPIHRLVAITIKAFKSATTDDRGFRTTGHKEGELDVRISPASLERAIAILNAVITALERLGYPVNVKRDAQRNSQSSVATIFGHEIRFDFVEKYTQIPVPENDRAKFPWSKIRYQPNGALEFRISPPGYGSRIVRDKKTQPLEQQITFILVSFIREGRETKLRTERWTREKIERQKQEVERQKLAEQIHEEEQKLERLDSWVADWVRAGQYREFVAALEHSWSVAGKDLSVEADFGKQLAWMRQQADRLDPLIESPKSILDRKKEISRRW